MTDDTREDGAGVPCSALLAAINREIAEATDLAVSEVASERLAGNVVKESYWRGELAALHRLANVVSANTGLSGER